MNRFDLPCVGFIPLEQTWSALSRFDPPWTGLIRPEQVWSALNRFDLPWAGLRHSAVPATTDSLPWYTALRISSVIFCANKRHSYGCHYNLAQSVQTGKPQVWPWQQVYTGTVERCERTTWILIIKSPRTTWILIIKSPFYWLQCGRSHSGHLDWVVWCWSDWPGRRG